MRFVTAAAALLLVAISLAFNSSVASAEINDRSAPPIDTSLAEPLTDSLDLGAGRVAPMAKPNCWCLEYLKFRWWSTRSTSYSIDHAYQMMRSVSTYGRSGEWHMNQRGYRYTESPSSRSVVIMRQGASFQYWNGSRWVNTSANASSGHAGWVNSSVSLSGNVRIFLMRHANWGIGSLIGNDSGCTNVRDVWVALQGTSNFNYYRP